MMNLGQISQWLEQAGIAVELVGSAETVCARLHTDTRSIEPGDLFIALKGNQFDANAMLPQARTSGAVAAIAHHGLREANLPGLLVADTLRALGCIAAAWRQQFKLPLIAVTGSNGKTTVTQMIGSILRSFAGDAASLITQGNFNNEIGVPLTLLRLRTEHCIGVVELGMNHSGEIAYLASLVQPQVVVVNNAQREHQEFMHSVEAVARENGSAIAHLGRGGVAVFPDDDAYTGIWRGYAAQHVSNTFSLHAGGTATVSAQADWMRGAWTVQARSSQGSFTYRLHIAGRHNVKNSLAAITACLAAGLDLEHIVSGLEAFRPVSGRCYAHIINVTDRNLDLIDDTYNANPDSVCAAIDVLADLPGPHLLVLGDMGEVGDKGDEFHAEVGEYAAEKGIESLYCLGDLMRYSATVFPGARHFANMESLKMACIRDMQDYRSILVKGSRFMRMEQVVKTLLGAAQESKEKLNVA